MCTACSGPSLSRLALAVLLSVQVAPAAYAQAGQVDAQGQAVAAQKPRAQPAKAAQAAQAAPAQGSAQEGVLPEVTVVGTNLPVDVQSYPGSVSVVQQEDLGRTSNVIEAMAAVPGVTTGGDSGRSTGQQFNIRGFGYQSEDRVIILQDGVRRSTALYSNHVSSFRADHDLLRRVEIVKGASSVQHGGGGIGGVVAMTNKDARDFLPSGQQAGMAAKLRYEHNNHREGYVAGAWAPQDRPVELLAYAKRGKTGDIRFSREYGANRQGQPIDTADNRENLSVAYVQGAVRLTGDQRLALSHYDYRIKNKTTWQTLYHTNYGEDPIHGKLSQQDTVLKYQFLPAHNPWLQLEASAYHSRAAYDRGYVSASGAGIQYKNADQRSGLRLSNESHFETGAIAHRLASGLSFERREEDAVYRRNGKLSDFGSMPNTYKDLGLYAHLESRLWQGRLTTQIGGRYDRFQRQIHNRQTRYRDTHFSPRLGASLEVASGLYLLANWSEAFRAPTPHETSIEGPVNPHYWYLPNPDLRPETIRETELGASLTRYGLLASGDVLRTKLMYFNGRIKDLITLRETRKGEVSPDDTPYGHYVNVDRVKRHGIEWQGSYERGPFGLGMSYATLRQIDQGTGKNTPQTFANKLALNTHLSPRAGLKLGLEVNHWFKPKPNPASTVSRGKTYWYVRKDFTITNVYAIWQPNPHGSGAFGRDFSVRVGINNLFDASYMNARDVETSSRVGKGRNVYVNLETRF
ncbi:TonB-dependent receptor domain-containing protein [Allofranklinella schreckenbergeri]|nr:TonB-dependent receptor [Allofranklinella schreckenbergeri]